MKDEFDKYTKDMFDKNPSKPIVDPDAREFSKMPPKLGREETKEAPKKIGGGGGGGGGGSGSLEKGMMGGRFKPTLHAKGGMVSSASKRADGCAIKGKTKGRMV